MSEEKNKYFQAKNKRAVPIRFNPDELTLLQEAMKKDGWTNVSGFIKYRLFGFDCQPKVDKLIESKDKEAVGTLLLNTSLRLADSIEYLNYRYNRDMQQLWREEGTDWKAWAKVTKKWHENMLYKTEEALTILRRVSEILGIEEYFVMPSDSMNIDPDIATKEQMDKMAEQLLREKIAMGHIDHKL